MKWTALKVWSTWRPQTIQLFCRAAPLLSGGMKRYSRTTMTTSTKAMTKVVILCQGLVYNPKTISTETLTVLALHSEVRRYSNLLLCNYSASGTLRHGQQEGYALLVCLQPAVLSFIINYLPLFVHIQLFYMQHYNMLQWNLIELHFSV